MGLMIPNVDSKQKPSTVQDAVFFILSTDFPLTLRQIHQAISRKCGIEVTNQAVFKTLATMNRRGIVTKKTNNTYQLDLKWIKNLDSFCQLVESNYASTEGFPTIRMHDNLSLHFRTIADLDHFIMTKLQSYTKDQSPTKALALVHHLWWPIFYSYDEYNRIDTIAKKISLRVVCEGKTKVDEWCAHYYQSIGIKVELGRKINSLCDIYVLDDYIVQVFYPPKVLEKIRAVYHQVHSMDEVVPAKFYQKLFERQVNLHVVINKNPELACELTEKWV